MGTLEDSIRTEFEEVIRPVISFLNDWYDPHTKIIVDGTSAEILSGEISFVTEDYIPDKEPIRNKYEQIKQKSLFDMAVYLHGMVRGHCLTTCKECPRYDISKGEACSSLKHFINYLETEISNGKD